MAAEDRTDYGTKLSQTLGSTKIAHMQKDYKLALEKITQLETIVASWKTQIVAAREAEANPPAPEEAPQLAGRVGRVLREHDVRAEEVRAARSSARR